MHCPGGEHLVGEPRNVMGDSSEVVVKVRSLALPRRYSAPAPASIAITSREAITPPLMLLNGWLGWIYAYLLERPSDFGGFGEAETLSCPNHLVWALGKC